MTTFFVTLVASAITLERAIQNHTKLMKKIKQRFRAVILLVIKN
jgi:hypothetical protein